MSENSILTFPLAEAKATGFYSANDAARLGRVPIHRLYAWRREGIIVPTVVATDATGKQVTGYTFHALTYLRVLRMLRDKRLPLFKTVDAVKHLRDRFGPPGPAWEDARIFIQDGDVFADSRDQWEVTVSTRKGQRVATLLMGDEFARLRDRADALLIPDKFQLFVEIDPAARSGLPIIRGTTIQTATPYGLRHRQMSLARIRESYPHLTLEQIKAAIQFERFLDAEAA